MLFVFLGTVIVIYLLQSIWRWRQSTKWADELPGRNDSSFYTLIFEMGLASPTRRSAMAIENSRTYPRYHCYLFMNRIHIHVNHPDLIKQVLTSQHCLKKSDDYKFAKWNHGIGVLLPDAWRVTRKHLSPTVGIKALINFVPIFNECSQDFVDILRAKTRTGEEFNLLQYSVLCTLDSICATSFGVKINALEKNIKFNQYLDRMHQIIMQRILSAHLRYETIFRFTKLYREDNYVRSQCEKFSEDLLKQRQSDLMAARDDKNNNSTMLQKQTSMQESFNILVDQLMHVPKSDGQYYTKEEIRDNVNLFISAGNETTALAVSHAVLLMAMHQDVQEKVVQELRSVFIEDHLNLKYEHLSELKYLERVIKETLRVLPSLPNIARESTGEIELDGHKIPAGIVFHISVIGAHYRPEDWGPDPFKFNPDNFLPDAVEARHPFAWFPFSIGIRNCLGYKYAMMSLKIMLVHLLVNFKFDTTLKWSEIIPRIDVHCHLNKPHLVSITERNFFNNNNNNNND